MEKTLKLKRKKMDLLTQARGILDSAESENREPNQAEKREFDQVMGDVRKTELEIEEAVAGESRGRKTLLQMADESTGDTRTCKPGQLRFINHDERLTDVLPAERDDCQDLNFGKYLRGAVTGEWADAEKERRALSSHLDASGSIMVPTQMSRQIWDIARNKAVVFRAGAVTVPMTSAKLLVPKLTQDPSGEWKSENADASGTTMTFGGVELQARTLFFWMEISQELLQDAGMLEAVIMGAFAEAAALELDRAALMGTGNGEEPRGLYYNTDITRTAKAALSPFDDFADSIYRCENANITPNACIFSPRSQNSIRKKKNGDGEYLLSPDWMPTQLVTKQIPDNLGSGSDESLAITGDFSHLLVGIRDQFKIGITGEGAAAKAYQKWIYGAMRCDVAAIKSEAFDIISEIESDWHTA